MESGRSLRRRSRFVPGTTFRRSCRGWLGRLRGKRSYAEVVNEHVLATNKWIRDYAREQGIALIDLQPLVADETGMRSKAFAVQDGSHLTEAGYARITAHADAVLARVLDH